MATRHFYEQFSTIAAAAGLRGFRFHDIRHAFATLTLADGRPVKEVQLLLGHSTANTTLSFYARPVQGLGREAVSKLSRSLLRIRKGGHPERNEAQAQQALLRYVDPDPARVHRMPGTDGPDGNDPEAAAARYAAGLRRAAEPQDHGPVPAFDVLLLGIGPEGHVASLFPGMPALYDERPVVAVRGAPKPPPTRIDHDTARYPAGP